MFLDTAFESPERLAPRRRRVKLCRVSQSFHPRRRLRRRPADWTFYANKHDFACCTSSNEIRLETHFAIFAVSLDACFCTYMQLCVRAPLARLVFNWISSLPSRSLPKLTTHAPDEVLACYIPSERDIYSAVLPANRDLRRQVKKPSYL